MELWDYDIPIFYIIIVIIGVIVLALLSLFCAWFAYSVWPRHDFRNKLCCVIGASRGIGQAVAIKLAQQGASSLLLIDVLPAQETKRKCEEAGCSNVVVINCDVSDQEQLKKLQEQIDKHDDIALVVNCAGVVSGKSFQQLSVDEFHRVVDVNVVGNFALLKTFLPKMLERGKGCFVAISSLMGLMGGAQLSDYCASKFGVVGLFEALRLELSYSHPGVSLVTVCPYAVQTQMFEGIFEATRLTRLIRTVFPLLTVEDTAESIIRAAKRGNSVAILPFYFTPLINIVRCLPDPLYLFVLTLMGGRDGMKKYRGISNVWGAKDKST